jgi:hypothetical protein
MATEDATEPAGETYGDIWARQDAEIQALQEELAPLREQWKTLAAAVKLFYTEFKSYMDYHEGTRYLCQEFHVRGICDYHLDVTDGHFADPEDGHEFLVVYDGGSIKLADPAFDFADAATHISCRHKTEENEDRIQKLKAEVSAYQQKLRGEESK